MRFYGLVRLPKTSISLSTWIFQSQYYKDPTWSPDGKKIAFSSHRDGDWEIYVMSADGENLERLIRSHGFDEHPDWCCLAFSVDRLEKLITTWGELKR